MKIAHVVIPENPNAKYQRVCKIFVATISGNEEFIPVFQYHEYLLEIAPETNWMKEAANTFKASLYLIVPTSFESSCIYLKRRETKLNYF